MRKEQKVVVDYLYKNYFSARSKAREDINKTAQQCGYKLYLLKTQTTTEFFSDTKHNGPFLRYLHHFKKMMILLKAIFCIPSKSTVLIQYPLSPFGNFFTDFFCAGLKAKSCKLVILVHDLVSYRQTKVFDKAEVKIMNHADHLILHTPNMVSLFKDAGIDKKVSLLYLFDYLTDDKLVDNPLSDEINVVFAGDLAKSQFLLDLNLLPSKRTKILLYGAQNEKIKLSSSVSYLGKFSPEKVSEIKGNWGLVWDGDSLHSCSGPLGDYLKLNSPHKMSLYIAAGIPVIVWQGSALSSFVESNRIGISVDSLYEIEGKINSFSKEEKACIYNNVSMLSEKIRKGGMLVPILNNL